MSALASVSATGRYYTTLGVATATGIPATTILAWERRYGLPQPGSEAQAGAAAIPRRTSSSSLRCGRAPPMAFAPKWLPASSAPRPARCRRRAPRSSIFQPRSRRSTACTVAPPAVSFRFSVRRTACKPALSPRSGPLRHAQPQRQAALWSLQRCPVCRADRTAQLAAIRAGGRSRSRAGRRVTGARSLQPRAARPPPRDRLVQSAGQRGTAAQRASGRGSPPCPARTGDGAGAARRGGATMRVLVTGGTGFIGGAIVQALQDDGRRARGGGPRPAPRPAGRGGGDPGRRRCARARVVAPGRGGCRRRRPLCAVPCPTHRESAPRLHLRGHRRPGHGRPRGGLSPGRRAPAALRERRAGVRPGRTEPWFRAKETAENAVRASGCEWVIFPAVVGSTARVIAV